MTSVRDNREAAVESESAELRRRLAECEAELEEARAQQTATAEVLQVINSSPGDLKPVFEAILDKALALCDAAFGMLSRYDGNLFHTEAWSGMPAAFVDVLRESGRPAPGGALTRIVEGEAVVHIADITDDELYRSGNPTRRALADLGGARTTLWIALRKRAALVGHITIYRQQVRPFSDRQIALLQNFAAQAVIAMENARLLIETREALDHQTATTEVLQTINSSPGDLVPVFDAMLEKAIRLCGGTRGVLWTIDSERGHVSAARGLSPEFITLLRERGESGTNPALQRIICGERLIEFPNTVESDFYRSGDPLAKAAVEAGVRSLIWVALVSKDANVGAFAIGRAEPNPFTDKQVALLQNFAAQAVIAMENARLLGELRARTDEIAAMNRELEARVAAQLSELERMGRLKRFLAPQLAEMIVARGEEHILESHRRDIVVVFCDLRGFTAFAETAEPEEVLDLLREYHAALGPIVTRSEGTLNHFTGDGLMVLFNDPLPCPDAPERAVAMALEMREAVAPMQARWRRHGRRIGFGVGIAQGYATVGQIGFAERIDYTAIGTVCNLAARLCAEAQDGQILVSGRIAAAVEDTVRLEEIGDLALKGLSQAVAVYNVAGI